MGKRYEQKTHQRNTDDKSACETQFLPGAREREGTNGKWTQGSFLGDETSLYLDLVGVTQVYTLVKTH